MATPTAPLLRLALLGVGLVLVLLPGALLMRELLHVGMQEDAMIGLRHLRNMLEGSGFVYNRGESALGTTNPLFWVFSFLAIKPFYLASPSVDVLIAHYYFCGFALLAAAIAFAMAAPSRTRTVSVAAMALLSVLFFWPLRFLYLGLEGPFMLFCLGVLGLLAVRTAGKREGLFATLVGFLSWNRPEIALILVPAVLFYALLMSDKSSRIRVSVGYVVGAMAFPLMLKLVSGAYIVGTVQAKAYFGNPSPPFDLDFFVQRIIYLDSFIGLGGGVTALLLVGIFASAIIGILDFLQGDRKQMPWVRGVYPAFVAGYSCFVLFIPSLWEWYVTFWLSFALVQYGVLISRGISCCFSALRDNAGTVMLGATVLLLSTSWLMGHRLATQRTEIAGWIAQDAGFRGRLSKELNERWHARSVWMEAAGWQGYFNNARIFDEVGLVDDETQPLAQKYGCAYFVSALRELQPQFIIKRQFEMDRNVMLTPPRSCPNAPLFSNDADRLWFDSKYEAVEHYGTPAPGYFGEYSFLVLYRSRKK